MYSEASSALNLFPRCHFITLLLPILYIFHFSFLPFSLSPFTFFSATLLLSFFLATLSLTFAPYSCTHLTQLTLKVTHSIRKEFRLKFKVANNSIILLTPLGLYKLTSHDQHLEHPVYWIFISFNYLTRQTV